jgi:TolB-like protein/cytochrome c-type biogenesis protein CcmH/NrfG
MAAPAAVIRIQVVNVQFAFADFVLDTDRRELRRNSELIALEPQVFDLLLYLVQHRDRVVTKDDLIASVWGGRVASEATLTSRTYAARKAIGDSGRQQKLIRTIPRKGLRFVGEVSTSSMDDVLGPLCAEPALGEPGEPRGAAFPLPDRPAIAVLAFSNMSDDPEQDYFSDGISEDLITALSRLRWFFVIARNSSFVYKGKPVNIRQVAEDLGVDYVIEGSVRKEGDRVRITAQLNDVATGSHLWAERYDRDVSDVFAVQDEITEAIVASIEPQLFAAENFRSKRRTPDNMDAWGLVMRALSHFWRVTRADYAIALQLLEKAIAIDPNYGQALAVLSTTHTFSAYNGWGEIAASVPVAERAALQAVRADSEDPWAHHALGCVHVLLRRFDEAIAEFELALSLNPSFALALSVYGLALAFSGRWEEAGVATAKALRLSPRDPFAAIYNGIAAYAQFVGRNYEEAMRLAGASIRLRTDHVSGYRMLTAAAAMAGQSEIAAAALSELRRGQPEFSLAWIAQNMPFKHVADRDHYLEAFRRAGLD